MSQDDLENEKKGEEGLDNRDGDSFGLPDFESGSSSSGDFTQSDSSSSDQSTGDNSGSILDYGGSDYADSDNYDDEELNTGSSSKKGGGGFVVVIVVLLLVFSGIGFGAFYFLGKDDAKRPAFVNSLIELTKGGAASDPLAEGGDAVTGQESTLAEAAEGSISADLGADTPADTPTDTQSPQLSGGGASPPSSTPSSSASGIAEQYPAIGSDTASLGVAASTAPTNTSSSFSSSASLSGSGQASGPSFSDKKGRKEVLSTRTGRYYVVVGSFLDGDFAEDFTNQLVSKGHDVRLLMPVGDILYHRVAISESPNYQEAVQDAERWKAEFGGSVWALRH